MRLTQWIEELRDDVHVGVSADASIPGFTAVAALTLALGIGANSAIFALADATFLRPLPFTSPHDRLVMLWERYPNGFLSQVTPLDFADWAEQNQSFDAMAAFLFEQRGDDRPGWHRGAGPSQMVSLTILRHSWRDADRRSNVCAVGRRGTEQCRPE